MKLTPEYKKHLRLLANKLPVFKNEIGEIAISQNDHFDRLQNAWRSKGQTGVLRYIEKVHLLIGKSEEHRLEEKRKKGFWSRLKNRFKRSPSQFGGESKNTLAND